jgi:hypothetical protein
MIGALRVLGNPRDCGWQHVLVPRSWCSPFWCDIVFRWLTQLAEIMDAKLFLIILLSWWIDLLDYSSWRNLWELIVERLKQGLDIFILNVLLLAGSLILTAVITHAPVLIVGALTILFKASIAT